MNTNGTPVTIDGLWSLSVGNNGGGGSSQKVYFTAGPDGESNGLFGVLTDVPEPASLAMVAIGLMGLGAARRRSRT